MIKKMKIKINAGVLQEKEESIIMESRGNIITVNLVVAWMCEAGIR
ncbi:MAG: hypothetical protein J6B50_10720 [Lachnospiraceae bacterium]|nr:hypothetical protein [Lachnospiraceae bacterium]MBP3507617.1 hypothetical protein [Lachnospiraceae bacterium]